MDLLSSLLLSPFFIVVLVGLLYFADVLHSSSDEGSPATEEGADSDTEWRDDVGAFHFDMAVNLRDVIGTYGDMPIHRYAEIGGAPYEFDYVYCPEGKMVVPANARCLAPGLVYSPARLSAAPSQ